MLDRILLSLGLGLAAWPRNTHVAPRGAAAILRRAHGAKPGNARKPRARFGSAAILQ